jgi:hypothetical protein
MHIPCFWRIRNAADRLFLHGMQTLEDCLRVLFYRNTKASTKIQIGTINANGISISEPYHLSTYWGYKGFEHTEYHGHKDM